MGGAMTGGVSSAGGATSGVTNGVGARGRAIISDEPTAGGVMNWLSSMAVMLGRLVRIKQVLGLLSLGIGVYRQ